MAANPYDRVHSWSEGKNGEPLPALELLLFETAMPDTNRRSLPLTAVDIPFHSCRRDAGH